MCPLASAARALSICAHAMPPRRHTESHPPCAPAPPAAAALPSPFPPLVKITNVTGKIGSLTGWYYVHYSVYDLQVGLGFRGDGVS